jgi:predicted amidohydrolase YtcJ
VAVRAGRLAAVGSSAEVQKLVTPATRVVDAHGAMVVPGFTVEEALRAYTGAAAYAEFQEHEKGTLAPGKLADFVLLDRDLTRTPPAELRNARVLMTVVGGTPVYERLPQPGGESPGPAAP